MFGPLFGSLSKAGRSTALFLGRNFGHIVLFLAVNVFFGAAGLWIPAWRSGSWWESLSVQFDNAGPYTFAVAFLAACLSYVGIEYLDKRPPKLRQWKMLLTIVAAGLLVLCAIGSTFTQDLPSRSATQPPAASQPLPQSADPASQTGEPRAHPQARDWRSGVATLWGERHFTQSALVTASVVIGFLIFLTFQALSVSGPQVVAEIEATLEAEADVLIGGLTGATSAEEKENSNG